MTILSLQTLGPALSSRSLARQLAQTVESDGDTKVTVDFTGVKACNQSFVNELLLVLLVEKKINVENIYGAGFDATNTHLEKRFNNEMMFFRTKIL